MGRGEPGSEHLGYAGSSSREEAGAGTRSNMMSLGLSGSENPRSSPSVTGARCSRHNHCSAETLFFFYQVQLTSGSERTDS